MVERKDATQPEKESGYPEISVEEISLEELGALDVDAGWDFEAPQVAFFAADAASGNHRSALRRLPAYDAPARARQEAPSRPHRDPRVIVAEEVFRPTLHAVPVLLEGPPHADVVLLSDPFGVRADAFRALRRRLSPSARAVAVTSAGSREGKTISALNLALAFREATKGCVLLVEANFRTPGVARLLGHRPPECFAYQLEARRDEPARPWTVLEPLVRLHVLAVEPTRGGSPVLDADDFESALASLLSAYDAIVVDTPAVLGGVDANVVADHVDATVVAVRARKTTRGALAKAVEQLHPAPVAGVVVLDV